MKTKKGRRCYKKKKKYDIPTEFMFLRLSQEEMDELELLRSLKLQDMD